MSEFGALPETLQLQSIGSVAPDPLASSMLAWRGSVPTYWAAQRLNLGLEFEDSSRIAFKAQQAGNLGRTPW
jgi:hypothetical protein